MRTLGRAACWAALAFASPKRAFAGVVEQPANFSNDNLIFLDSGERDERALEAIQLPIIEIVAQTSVLQDLEVYLLAARLVDMLTNKGPYTFFPPWDNAWDKFAPDWIEKFRQPEQRWRGHLRNLLEYHIHFGAVPRGTLASTQTLGMANGEDLHLTLSDEDDKVRANGVLSISEYDSTDGYIYMLDHVLIPAWMKRNLLDLATSSLSTMTRMVVTAEMEETLRDADSALTVFACPDEAFESLSPAVMNYLESPNGKLRLREILSYHVVDGLYPIMNMPSMGAISLDTLLGGESKISVTTGVDPITVAGVLNDAVVTTADLFATNGVAHKLSSILLNAPFADSIVELVSDRSDLSDLAAALTTANLVDTLDAVGPFLIFAPTNTAFNSMDSVLRNFLLNDEGWILHLQTFLLKHVTKRAVSTEGLANDETFTMLTSEQVQLSRKGQGMFMFSPSFGFPSRLGPAVDLQGLNGIVTTITRPLAPSWATHGLYNILHSQDETRIIAGFFERAELALPALAREANWMVRYEDRPTLWSFCFRVIPHPFSCKRWVDFRSYRSGSQGSRSSDPRLPCGSTEY